VVPTNIAGVHVLRLKGTRTDPTLFGKGNLRSYRDLSRKDGRLWEKTERANGIFSTERANVGAETLIEKDERKRADSRSGIYGWGRMSGKRWTDSGGEVLETKQKEEGGIEGGKKTLPDVSIKKLLRNETNT